MPPLLIGLTGGIAAGKSTVSGLLKERGAHVVDADEVAREVVMPGSVGLARIVEAFGSGVLRPDGTLDRASLGAVVFADVEARRTLEQLTHPLIAAQSQLRLAEALESGAPLIVYDAALLFESGRADHFRPVVVVTVNVDVQRARLMARDGLTAEQAQSRIDAQMPLGEKVKRADHVIDNGGSLEETRARVDALWQILRL
ncbi:MAG: dephospho-CoA kinase [Myxococcales bacterium]|nr:dephospho-CoA kinase [Myxococcales bacterium]